MTYEEPAFDRPARHAAVRQAWGALFWILFVADLSLMQYLFALVLVTPFALMVGGLAALVGWLPLLFFQTVYAVGLIYACVLRERRPIVTAALLLATPVIVYGGWYLSAKVGLTPRALSPLLS